MNPREALPVGSDDSDGYQTPSEMPAAGFGTVNARTLLFIADPGR